MKTIIYEGLTALAFTGSLVLLFFIEALMQ